MGLELSLAVQKLESPYVWFLLPHKCRAGKARSAGADKLGVGLGYLNETVPGSAHTFCSVAENIYFECPPFFYAHFRPVVFRRIATFF